jgi:hypothetical protein
MDQRRVIARRIAHFDLSFSARANAAPTAMPSPRPDLAAESMQALYQWARVLRNRGLRPDALRRLRTMGVQKHGISATKRVDEIFTPPDAFYFGPDVRIRAAIWR